MPTVSIEPVVIQRPIVVRPGSGRVERFTPAASGPIRITCDVGADSARVTAVLRDAAGHELARQDHQHLRKLELTASPTIDPSRLGHFTVELRNDSSVEGAGTLLLAFPGRLVTDELPLAKLNRLATVVARNEINPRIELGDDTFALRVDERHDDSVPPALKRISRELDVGVTLWLADLQLGKDLTIEFRPASATYPAGSVRATVTVARVRLKKGPLPLGGADQAVIRLDLGLAFDRGRFLVHRVDTFIDWDPAGLLNVIDPRPIVAGKLDEAVESFVAAHRADIGKAATWLKTLMQLDELLDVRVTASAFTVRGIGGPSRAELPTGPITTPPRGRLQHLVVVMMENRSFDHMLGDLMATRPRLGALPQYREEHGGKTYRLRPATTSKVLDDPPHGSKEQAVQAAGRYVEAYVDSGLDKGSDPGEVLTYQPADHVPFFRFLVDHACVCLDWRAAIPGQTWPNRNYGLSGTSGGVLDNAAGGFDFYDLPTVCEVLNAHRPDQWRYFKSDVGFLELYRRWFRDDHHLRRAPEFHQECRDGVLRAVTWVEPNISDFGSERGSDDHPPADIKFGQGFLSEVYRSLCAYSKKTGDHDWLLVITYDEHGGFYDSKGVGPLVADDDEETRRRGFRVPAFLVSPWLPASVCTAPFDHASIVRSVLDQFCGDSTLRDVARVREATSFAEALDRAVDERWPNPRTAPVVSELARLGKEFFPPPPASGSESAIDEAIDSAEIVLDGDGATTDLWRQFLERKREALRADSHIQAGAGGNESDLDGGVETPVVEAVDALPVDGARIEGILFDYVDGAPPAVLRPELDAPGWTLVPFAGVATRGLLLPPAGTTIAEAWTVAHALDARLPGGADPLWETAGDPAGDVEAAPTGPDAIDWSLALIKAREAWAEPSPSGRHRGDGVVVAHLDTGLTDHDELRGVFATGLDRDLLDGDRDARDPLDEGLGWYPGHGTATASVLASREDDGGRLVGVAPAARLIAYRVSRSVVHLSMRRMIEAIELATVAGAHVISISAGGPWSPRLQRAVRAATAAGVVVVAAAGNYSPWTVWPARFPEVVSCGACTADLTAWRWSSSRGPVTLHAPGAGVWVARPGESRLGRGSGTSFATAMVAGAVATWLSFHGRDRLLALYGRQGLVDAARTLLVQTATATASGPRVLDVHALVRAPLPDLELDLGLGAAEAALDAPDVRATPAVPPRLAGELAFFDDLAGLRQTGRDELIERHGSAELRAALAAT